MNNIIIILLALLSGCSTLGFGDFDLDTNEVKNNGELRLNDPNVKKAATKFIYQPLTGGKHAVFLAGDFNGWSSTETPMEEIDGIYGVVLSLDEGKYGYKFVVDGNWIVDENATEFLVDFWFQSFMLPTKYTSLTISLG